MRAYKSTIYSPGDRISNHTCTNNKTPKLFFSLLTFSINFKIMFILGLVLSNQSFFFFHTTSSFRRSWCNHLFLIFPTPHLIVRFYTKNPDYHLFLLYFPQREIFNFSKFYLLYNAVYRISSPKAFFSSFKVLF